MVPDHEFPASEVRLSEFDHEDRVRFEQLMLPHVDAGYRKAPAEAWLPSTEGKTMAPQLRVQNLLLRPLPYPHPDRLVEIANTYFPQVPKAGPTPGEYFDWRQQNASFSGDGRLRENSSRFQPAG